MTLVGAVSFGILHGVRHTFEPDHLAAVSVLVTNSRGIQGNIALGALWGLGHTLSLTAVSSVFIVAGAQLPSSVGIVFTILVATLLALLGIRAVAQSWREKIRGDATQPHAHSHPHRPIRSRLQAFAVGTIHGLAGSGGITALAAAGMPSPSTKIAFVMIFGLASTVGMATVSAVAGMTFARFSRPWITRLLATLVGSLSIIIGANMFSEVLC